jgi:hypothetical protein
VPANKKSLTFRMDIILGVLLFLFIPLVLFLFLRFPFGIVPSFAVAILMMFGHRFLARPFMMHYRLKRCLWCGRSSRPRQGIDVATSNASSLGFEVCVESCNSNSRRFFDFIDRHKRLLRAGIFLPLVWYVISMLLIGLGRFSFPIEWNRFLFQFFIACTVVSISFLYKTGMETDTPSFRFPIHNLFLLGIKNTLLVFRYVGIWWLAASLYFLFKRFQ